MNKRSIFNQLLSFFFPVRCFGCGVHGVALCTACTHKLPFARPTEHAGIIGIYDYAHPIITTAIHHLKYHRHSELAHTVTKASVPHIAEHIAEILQTAHKQSIVLIPIPGDTLRSRARGFNQSERIASWIAAILPGSSIEHILVKHRSTQTQVANTSRYKRLHNLTNSMSAHALNPDSIYIVIDDVTTTGATFIEARRALTIRGARNVLCIALAHGYKRRI